MLNQAISLVWHHPFFSSPLLLKVYWSCKEKFHFRHSHVWKGSNSSITRAFQEELKYLFISLSLHFLFQIGDSNDGENQLVPRPPSAGKSRLPLTPPRHTALTKARMVRFLVYSLSRWSPRGPFIIRKLMGFSEWQKRFWENRGQVI